jgi:SAM-dependent methyltransferase
LNNINENGEFVFRQLDMECAAGEDNSTDGELIQSIIDSFDSDKINWLDLGCGGGQLVLDANQNPKTDICIGIDGSCGVYKQSNWSVEENLKVLKHANLVEDFTILSDGEIVKFDVISCSEVIEHFAEDQLDVFFENVEKHLSDRGVFYGSIALFSDIRDDRGYYKGHPSFNPNSEVMYELHKTVYESRDPWDDILSKYFDVVEYDFPIRMRNHSDSYYFKCVKKNNG